MTERIIRPATRNGTDQVLRTESHSSATKQCTRGGEQKAIADMAADRHRSDGCRTVCKDCRAAYDRQRYWANRQSILAHQREYQQANPGAAWASGHRTRARKYGLSLTTEYITPADVIGQWGDRCLYCHIGRFEVIDHFMPVGAGGSHTQINVMPCCRKCNGRKRWTFDEWLIRDFRQGKNEHRRLQALADRFYLGR